jgi:hypothetical protein
VSVNDDPHCGQPSTSTNENIQPVHNVVPSDQQKCTEEILAEIGISVGSIHNIVHTDLNMHYICEHLAPNMLTPDNLAGDLITMDDQRYSFFEQHNY